MRPASLLAACALLGSGVGAASAAEGTPEVKVTGIRNPQMRAYRSVAAGLDAFDRHRTLAPAVAAPRFRFILQPGIDDGSSEPLALRIAGQGVAIPVPIGNERDFTVPRSAAAYDDDADLVLNRKNGLYRPIVLVRSPGLAPNVMRLGDVRMECQVTIAIVKKELPLLALAAINSLMLTGDWCNKHKFNFSVHTDTAPNKATLVWGERRQNVPVEGHSLAAPIGEHEWPDDALIELE